MDLRAFVAAVADPADQPPHRRGGVGGSAASRVGGGSLRRGDLHAAVAVDVLGLELHIGVHGGGEAGGPVLGDVGQSAALLPHQDIRHGHALAVDAGGKHGGGAVGQLPHHHTAPAQLRHGVGQDAAVAGGDHVVLADIQPRHRLAIVIRPEQQQALDAVAVQVRDGEAGIAALQQHIGVRLRHIHGHGLHVGADAPAHDDLQPAVAGEVLILDAVDGGAAAFDDAQAVIGVVLRPENEDFQGLFVVLQPHEYQGLRQAVVVQVHHLHRLDVLPGAGAHQLIALLLQVVQLLGQPLVFRRHPGQGEQILHRRAEHTPGQGQRHNRRQKQRRHALRQMFH